MEQLTQSLRNEHRVILNMLGELEKSLEPYSLESLWRILRFFDTALPFHRGKEEGCLFPEMARHYPPHAGPVACMLEEHREERELWQAFRQGLMDGDRATVAEQGRKIVDLLRRHIWKEEHILFPLAEEVLSRFEQTEVRIGFARVGSCCGECAEKSEPLHEAENPAH